MPIPVAPCIFNDNQKGQTFDKVGIYMERPCFSHGQLYVAFSRARRFADVSVQIVKSASHGRHCGGAFTSNVVRISSDIDLIIMTHLLYYVCMKF